MIKALARRSVLLAAVAGAAHAAPADGALADQPLRALAADKGLTFGCASDPERLVGDPEFGRLVERQCAQVTAENVLKWLTLRPAASRFDFSRSDALADWLSQRGMGLYGHCLVWHEALPPWLTRALTPRSAEGLLSAHIAAVAGRYRGRVVGWDVVIEAVERADQRPDGLRRSPWLEALGPDYLSLSFKRAREADPHALLALADYGLEYDDSDWMRAKRVCILRLLTWLKRNDAPVQALNIQSHLLADRPAAFGPALRAFLREVADLGLSIVLGELDVDDQRTAGDSAARDRLTADIVQRYLDVVLDEPAVTMLSTWGLSDRYTAKTFIAPRADGDMRPLPFSRELQPKLAEQALASALRGAPARRPLVRN